MDPRTGGWHYNKNSDPPLDWDTSRDAAKYFRVVRWIDSIVANSYSPNDKDPSEFPPTYILSNGTFFSSSYSSSSSATNTIADTALPPAGTQLPRQLRFFEIQGDDEDDGGHEESASSARYAGGGGRADDGQGWNAQLPETIPAAGGKKFQTVWAGLKTFKAKGNFYELRVEKAQAGGGGLGRASMVGSGGGGSQQGVPASAVAGIAYANRSTAESFAEVAGRSGGGSAGRGAYTPSPRGGGGGWMRGRGRGRGIGGGGGGRGGGIGGGVYRRDGLL
ncbi:hypothetical protein L873DRAFT_1800713 [Choiromyces venosus 120613-1]|uniref:Uncharacterized protein n=1 Tax=Choiromyces venosus 120613-1 TaxID=1336337 RepID=A0A3N4JYY6_9PEZI|nr:hypothetical protein L873DRAFT_1800713 [Choiromyces venosus 120613-1]